MSLPADTIIRAAEPDDARALSAIAARLFIQTYESEVPRQVLEAYVAEDFNPELQRAELRDPGVVTLLAEQHGAIAGYAQVRRQSAPLDLEYELSIELWRIYLDRSCHGRGIGKRLLAAAGKAARSMSGEKVWLGVWERNTRAIAFYEKHGFSVAGYKEFNIGTEIHRDLVMAASVNAL